MAHQQRSRGANALSAEDFDYDQWSVMVGFTLYFGGE
jgi:hypothetical protein